MEIRDVEPLQVEAGHLGVPARPALGLELDMDGVERRRWRAADPR